VHGQPGRAVIEKVKKAEFLQLQSFPTGIGWFNPADAPGFALHTDVTVSRPDTASAPGPGIAFRSLCVKKAKT
jgi:hypothetical protein